MHCLINSTQSKEFAQSHTVLVLSPFCSKPDHMGERSGLARTDRLRAYLSAKSSPHSLTGCSSVVTGKDDCLGQDKSKANQDGWYLPPQTEEGEQRKSTVGKKRKASHGTRSIPTLRGQCGVGVSATSPVDSFQSWMTF